MTDGITAVTKQDFDRLPWRDVLKSAPGHDCISWAKPFYDLADKAKLGGDLAGHRAYNLLANCSFLHLDPKDVNNPLQVIFSSGVGRSASIEDIALEDVPALMTLAPEIENVQFRARIADIAWILNRDYRSSILAVESYTQSAMLMSPDQHWTDAIVWLERALRISYSLGHGGIQQQDNVVEALSNIAYENSTDLERSLYPAHAMELLRSVGEGDAARLKDISANLADRAFARGGWNLEEAEWYWRLASHWARKLDLSSEATKFQMQAAKVWIYIAKQYMGEHPNYLTAANYLERAHNALRDIGQSEEARALEPELFRVQELALGEMKAFTHKIDLIPFIEDIEGALKNSTLSQALSVMVVHIVGPTREYIKQLVDKNPDSLSLDMLVGPTSVVNERGRVVGRGMSRLSDDPKAQERALEDELHNVARMYRDLVALGYIDTARRIITQKFRLSEYQIAGLLEHTLCVSLGVSR